MSKIPFSSIPLSTEVFPDFVTPVTIEGLGLSATFDDVSGNVISVNYEEFAETLTDLISSGTLSNTLATKQYVDSIIINNDNSAVHLAGQETITGQKTFTQDVIIPETTDDTVSSAAVTKAYVDANMTAITENINSVNTTVLTLDTYVDNVSSYANTINEKLNTVSGDVATIITFRTWPDDE